MSFCVEIEWLCLFDYVRPERRRHAKVDRVLLNAMLISGAQGAITLERVEDNAFHLRSPKDFAQFVFCPLENAPLVLRQVFPGAIDIKV